jgi:hypothetical protein
MLPAIRFNVAKCVEEFQRIGVKIHVRSRVCVVQRIDFQRAIVLAADNAAGFIRRVAARVHDELV